MQPLFATEAYVVHRIERTGPNERDVELQSTGDGPYLVFGVDAATADALNIGDQYVGTFIPLTRQGA